MQDHHALRNQLQDIDYGPAPSILLFSDDPHQRDWIASAVSAAGGRIAAVLDLADAVDRIAEQAAPDGVIADIGSAPELQAESILAALETGAQSYRFRSIALIARERIDLAVATAEHDDVQLLCEPDHNALASAIAGLLAPRDRSLNDVSTEARPIKLRELSEEVGRIARTLAALSQPEGDRDGSEPAIDAAAIRAMIRARRLRDRFFGDELFQDPVWDMLLDLAAARLEGLKVSVSSLCIAAAVPPTTALREIGKMTRRGLLERMADPVDRRRIFITLSEDAAEAVFAFLRAARRITAGPI